MKGQSKLLCFLAVVSVVDVPAAQAIPAFARREGVQCQMCHFRPPELNEDGHAYLRLGLREDPPDVKGSMGETGKTDMGGKEGMPSKAPVAATPAPLGQPLLIDWAKYLTVMGHHGFTAQTGQRTAFDAGVFDLWAAGPIDQKWSALANPSFDIQNGGSSVDQAYGQFISHWGDKFQSARFGKTLPLAILFNQGGPSMSISTPLVLSYGPDTGTSWTPATQLRGLEIGAVNLPRWNVYVGAGQPHLESPLIGLETHTDVYASAEYLIGENGNSVSLYGYSGRAWLSPAATGQSFHRIGLFGNAFWPKTKAVVGYLTGRDKDINDVSLDNTGGFLLVEHLLSERWAVYARYDHMRQDLTAGGSQTIQGPTIGVSWWAQTQIRLNLEARSLEVTGQRDDKMLMTEFMWLL
ncbi:MAG: hypothetical protein ACYC1M_14360 [Armatimonadota bacterium]